MVQCHDHAWFGSMGSHNRTRGPHQTDTTPYASHDFHPPRHRHTTSPQPHPTVTNTPQPPSTPAPTIPTSPPLTPHASSPTYSPHTQSISDSLNDCDIESTTSDHKPSPPNLEPTECLEPWVDWIKRCTHEIEERVRKLRLEDWVTLQRRRKWRYARKVLLANSHEWNTAALHWDPTLDHKLNTHRRPGRPKTRWTDDLQQHIQRQTQTPWLKTGTRNDIWITTEEKYVQQNNI